VAKRAAKRKRTNKVELAKRIIRAQVKSGNQRSKIVHRAVTRAGISTRTYRTARKQMHTVAVRRNRQGFKRGKGIWYVTLG
jgi:hypothetical protein